MGNHEYAAERVVIVAGPSFGDAIQFLLAGAVLGAAGALIWKSRTANEGHTNARDAVVEGLTAGGAKGDARSAELTERLTALARRVKVLAGHARDTAAVVGGAVAPMVRSAVEEGKHAAQRTTHEMAHQLKNEPDTIYATPSIEEDEA